MPPRPAEAGDTLVSVDTPSLADPEQSWPHSDQESQLPEHPLLLLQA